MREDMGWKNKNDLRAISIVRVSSYRQKDNTSHEVQTQEIAEYAESVGLTIVKPFKLVESAKDSSNREDYQEAIQWALKNKIKNVLFYMTDREARNYTDMERNQRLVKKDVLVLHYVREKRVLHSKSPHSDFLMREFQALQDKQVSEIISIKVNDAQRRKAESGWYPGNRPPLGYVNKKERDESGRELKRGTTIVPDPNERNVKQVVREFELRAKGLPYEEIRKQIIEEGLVSGHRVSTYRASSIEKRITNPFYYGKFIWQGEEFEAKHALIVPIHVLNAVKETFGKRGLKIKPPEEQGLFGNGYIKCGNPDCGCAIIYDPKTKVIKATGEVKEYRYYHCTNGKKAHESLAGLNITEDKIMDQLGAAIDCIAISEDFAAAIAEVMRETHEKARSATIRQSGAYKDALRDLDAREDEIYDDFKNGILDQTAYERMRKKIREQRMRYTELLEEGNLAIGDAYMKKAQYILELASKAKSLWISRSPAERKQLLDLLLSNRVLDAPTVRFEFKKPFAVLRLMRESEIWRPHGDSNPGYRRERDVTQKSLSSEYYWTQGLNPALEPYEILLNLSRKFSIILNAAAEACYANATQPNPPSKRRDLMDPPS